MGNRNSKLFYCCCNGDFQPAVSFDLHDKADYYQLFINDKYNLGQCFGRFVTFPFKDICYLPLIESMVTSGFRWQKDGSPHGKISCIVCGITLVWYGVDSFLNAHITASPDCPWMRRFNSHKDMTNFYFTFNLPRNFIIETVYEGVKIQCLKCDFEHVMSHIADDEGEIFTLLKLLHDISDMDCESLV